MPAKLESLGSHRVQLWCDKRRLVPVGGEIPAVLVEDT